MSISKIKPKVIDGNRVLLPISLGLFVLSSLYVLSVIWYRSRSLILFVGPLTVLATPVCFAVACWEAFRYQHKMRTLLAVFVSFAATFIAWGTVVLITIGRIR